MSVINQVLQDLEKRGVPRGPAESMGSQVRAVSGRSPGRWPLAAAVAAAVAAAAAVWFLSNRTGPAPVALATRASETPKSSVAASPPVAEAAQPASRLSMELSAVPAPRSDATQTGASQPMDQRPAPAPKPEPRSEPEKPAAAKAVARNASPKETQAPAAGQDAQAAAPFIAKAPAGTGNSSRSEEASRQFKQVSPQQRAENEFRRAVGLMQQGRVSEAVEGYGLALQIDPGHEAARQVLVGLLIENKRVGAAAGHLQEGLRINPKQVGFAMTLARIQVERGELGPAVETLEKVRAYGQSQPDYRAFLAALLQRQSRHREAIEHYQAAVRAAPSAGVWLMGLGISLEAEQRIAEAREAFQRAHATNTLNPELAAFVDQRLRQIQQSKQ
ncbi:MAG: tetratricopeptide repeat protein [Betaproteobacteria bacterium]|nr:tetratricopeptide repeat protein [Betaproteobacteria bacterium]